MMDSTKPREKVFDSTFVPQCPCHLCQKIVFEEVDEDDGLAWYSMNGKMITVRDIDKCMPPSIFCPFIDMWRSQWFGCCCTTHFNPLDCENHGALSCTCPRCCPECMGFGRYYPDLVDGGKIDCHKCSLKSKFYTPCHHFRGFCSKSSRGQPSALSDPNHLVSQK